MKQSEFSAGQLVTFSRSTNAVVFVTIDKLDNFRVQVREWSPTRRVYEANEVDISMLQPATRKQLEYAMLAVQK